MVVPILRVLAWLALLGGLVGALWWYDLYGEVAAYSPYAVSRTEQSPVALAIALGIAANGMYWCAVAHGIATAVEHLIALRHSAA
ncbi:MAG TPA: hypothetical protein VK399_13720, partial [Longimicrobiaceae bacterium]|nr:hypothetical protein [Longimicrobiaceae bacterium]